VLAPLRLGDHELAADELERLTIEDADVNQALVFHSPPPPRCEGRLLHGASVATDLASVNA
jgi:hypothetical protein